MFSNKWKHLTPTFPHTLFTFSIWHNLAPRPPPSPPLQISLELYRPLNEMRFKTSDESPSGLKYAINHVFLPPRLPQADDASLENELFLAKSFYESLLGFRQLEPASSEALNPALDMVERFSEAEHITPLIIRAMICGLNNGGKHPSRTHPGVPGQHT